MEGSVTFEDKSGREETFKVGDAVLIPRGTEFA
jgi:mannose-6-phosphate isomerase-like protein (cupin superfamily)